MIKPKHTCILQNNPVSCITLGFKKYIVITKDHILLFILNFFHKHYTESNFSQIVLSKKQYKNEKAFSSEFIDGKISTL